MAINIYQKAPRTLCATGAAVTLLVAGTLLAAYFFSPNNQPHGYLAGLAASNSILSSGSETLYAPYFEEGSYGGDLMAIPVDAQGTPDYLNPRWRATQTLSAANWDSGRDIITTDGAGNAIAFAWDTLTATQRAALDPVTAADAGATGRTASPILNFLRGDRSQEAQNGGSLRDRTSMMGDIIHTTPRYVRVPSGGHLTNDYPAFAVANATRPPRVYASANDGMLHAFDADTGEEIFAFVPSVLMSRLTALTQRPYLHQYLVDGHLTVQDAYYGGAWHTVLVGGLGAGGQGYFALDVTTAEDGATTTETLAGAKVLWEYDHTTDANLGFTYGRPSIVPLAFDGSFAVLVPNGYVNTAGDGHSGDGRARLVALDVATGAKLGEIWVDDPGDSAGAPNGLSSPSAADTDGDGRVDTVFAGDLKGNLWRFDVSRDPAGWSNFDATLVFTASHAGVRQAITTAPELSLHPADSSHAGLDLMVLFGTGRLLDSDDYNPLTPKTDSIYGLWVKETIPTPIVTSDLLVQTLTEATHTNGTRTRTASDNLINWTTHDGWMIDLPTGERVLTDPLLRRQRLQLTTTNPLEPSGENWYLSIGYADARAPGRVVLDIDGDSNLSAADNVDGNGDGDSSDPEDRAVGEYQQFGLASAPLLVTLDGSHSSALINHVSAISPAEVLPEISDPSDPGLRGGHFDLDVSHEIYPFDGGSTDVHKHEWDDKSGLSVINYMNIPRCNGNVEDCIENPDLYSNDPAFTDLPEQVTNPTQRFFIVVLNSHLSPGGVLEINGSSVPVVAYEELVRQHAEGSQNLPVYQLGDNPPAGVQKLTSFKLSFSANAIIQGGLIGSATGCVRGNKPGAHGEYRNGALTVQVIDADTGAIANTFHQATSGLLWESTAFWHWKGGCYGTDSWAESYQACFVEGDVCQCLDNNDIPGLCTEGGSGSTDPGDSDPDPDSTGGSDGGGCTVTATNPNPRTWDIEMEKPLCQSATIPPTQLKLEFEKDVDEDQTTTLTVHYGGTSQSITFSPTDLFSGRTGSPLQFDLTEIEFKGKEVKKILLRNVGTSDIVIDSVEVSWTGANAGQLLKKVKREKPTGTDFTSGLPAVSPATVATSIGVEAAAGGPACQYTLAVDYTLPDGGTSTSTHAFDPSLSGISGYPLEIDMDESSLDDDRKVNGIRIRSRLNDPITITGVTLSWSGATADQEVKKIRDTSDGDFDIMGSGTSPKSETGLSIGIGGKTVTGDNCPVEAPDGTSSTGGSSEGGSGSSDGGSGSSGGGSGGEAVDGGPRAVVGALSGFNISNTTTLGGSQRGRLMWREVVR